MTNYDKMKVLLEQYLAELDKDFFDSEDPVEFAKNHVTYILVVSKEKNENIVRKIHECILAGGKYKLPYLEKLEKYIFKEVYVYTPEYIRREFVEKFEY